MIRSSKRKGRANRKMAELGGLLRAFVLHRDGHRCVKCGKAEGEPTQNGFVVLQAAHVRSKGKGSRLRFEPDNLMTLCIGCHIFWWHKQPHDAVQWFEATYPRRYDRLLVAERCSPKLDLDLLLQIWRKETAELRSGGVTP